MTTLADGSRHFDGLTLGDQAVSPADIPELMARLARRMAEVWLQTLAPGVTSLTTPTRSGHDGDYTAKELGHELQMSESTIYKHWRAGAWPNAYMISKRKGLRIPRSDVDAWKASKMSPRPTWGPSPKANIRSIRKAS